MREVLLACVERTRERARLDFRHAELLWQIRATRAKNPGQPPQPPRILRED